MTRNHSLSPSSCVAVDSSRRQQRRFRIPLTHRGLRCALVAAQLLLGGASIAIADVSVSVGIAVPGVNVGINMPAYPQLVQVPGYPVYYAPGVPANYFFYDGAYWVFDGGNWYASGWYNGPWQAVAPLAVPAYVLRVPVRYYRRPPPMFHDWRRDAPPHWGEHWGREWESSRHDWDKWDHRHAPRPAPLPDYQRRYAGEHYPRAPEQQQTIRAAHEHPGGPHKDEGRGRGNGRGDDNGGDSRGDTQHGKSGKKKQHD